MRKDYYNSHLNPSPYPTSPRVKFHIQNEQDVEGVAMCGGIYDPQRFMVFSVSFVRRMNTENHCLCCLKESGF